MNSVSIKVLTKHIPKKSFLKVTVDVLPIGCFALYDVAAMDMSISYDPQTCRWDNTPTVSKVIGDCPPEYAHNRQCYPNGFIFSTSIKKFKDIFKGLPDCTDKELILCHYEKKLSDFGLIIRSPKTNVPVNYKEIAGNKYSCKINSKEDGSVDITVVNPYLLPFKTKLFNLFKEWFGA